MRNANTDARHRLPRASRARLVVAAGSAVCAAAGWFSEPARAVTVDRTWVGPNVGSFSTALNWSGNVVPDIDDVATFDNPALFGTVNMPSTADTTNLRLRMLRGDMLFDLNGRTWELTAPATSTVDFMSLIVGFNPTDTGTALFSGGGTMLCRTVAVGVSSGSRGTLQVFGGTRVASSDVLRIAVLGGTGSVSVTNGTFTAGALLMSQGGASSLTVGSGGFFSTGFGGADIARGGAPATVLVQDGGDVQLGGTAMATGVDGIGSIRVTGAGSRFRSFDDVNVGLAGIGSFTVDNAGTALIQGDMSLGSLSTGAGSLLIRDAGSRVTIGASGNLFVGGGSSGAGGFGRAIVQTGGLLEVTGFTQLFDQRIDLAGGTLRTGDLRDQPAGGPGTVNWTSGSLEITNATFHVGTLFGVLGNSVPVGAGKVLRVPNNAIQNDGSINISGGGRVDAHTLRVGSDPGSFGAPGFVSVTDNASQLNVLDSMLMSPPAAVGGGAGASTFNLSSGRVLIENELVLHPLARATVSGGSFAAGALTIRGGSFSQSGPNAMLVSRDLTTFPGVGLVVDSIPGTFVQVEAGGRLSTVSGRIGVSSLPAAAGSLTVTGAGSQWNTGSVIVGGPSLNTARGALAVADGARFTSTGAGVRVNVMGSVQYSGGSFTASGLVVSGGRVLLSPGGGKVLRVATDPLVGAFAVTGGGLIDLSDNGMIVADAGPTSFLTHVRDGISSAYNGGAWDGPGITSSTANATTHGLGYGDASDVFTAFPATFLGHTVGPDNTLVRYTRYGDANLDGTVNLHDFNELAGHFGTGSGAVWTDGDFNYDGAVNLADFNRLASNFGLAAAGTAVSPGDWSALGAAVPEPSVCAILAPVLGFLSRRARRPQQATRAAQPLARACCRPDP